MFHFSQDSGHLAYGDDREIREGETLTVTGETALCQRGLHASPTVPAALGSSPRGLRLWSVELGGDATGDEQKMVSRSRTAIRDYGDQTAATSEFARWCAARAAHAAARAADAYAAARAAYTAAYTAASAAERAEQVAWWDDYLSTRYGE